jgi:hypothetical protein
VFDYSAHHASWAANAASSSANSVVWNSKDSLSLTNNSSVDYINAVNLEILSANEFFYSVKWAKSTSQSACALSSAALAAAYSSAILALMLFNNSKIFMTFS